MTVKIEDIADFIFDYAKKYRSAYAKAKEPPPAGPGYPDLVRSPYLEAAKLTVYVASDGVIISQESEPEHQWFIAGGPAIKVDYEPTRTPTEHTLLLKSQNLFGKNIGIYRVVSKKPLASCVWRGRIQNIVRELIVEDKEVNIQLTLREIDTPFRNLINILTFGALGEILDVHFSDSDADYGKSHLVQNMGFFPADNNNRRFFKYLEIISHSDTAAWDKRLIYLKVQQDLRRDLGAALTASANENLGGLISQGAEPKWLEAYSDRLDALKAAIADLGNALKFHEDEIESVFHEILEKHPLLLDVYGFCESKPELRYPEGYNSPIGKTKLQPDFIIRYPDQSYKLIEIERPSKKVATTQGQPRAEVSQAVFQTAEWKHFFKTHYHLISSRYPGIQSKCKTSVIMSRFTQEHFKNVADAREYMGLMMEQFNIDEFLTFDDLFERALTAYNMLSGLSLQSDLTPNIGVRP
ncbi:hypothetical protein A7J50_1763 [Pseudomonas antarctica]|uniref:Shedu protein SduA C-terminal domain-containing protein n=1 Tax=Pseudomonas antarctica TaxID=219572 RepID=A0A172YY10_9PSED|nr:Shedu anti-phage system protein SduA domain-containing protein [Pseudomonas antarctica]ANF85185.1 hypothetical protein A7J50_1763 [Pseudomonas antarctica]